MLRWTVLLASAALGSCSMQSTQVKNPFPANEEAIQTVAGIGQDRIQFIGQFSSPQELGYQADFSARFRKFLGGGQSTGLVRPYAVDENEAWLVIADPGAGQVICIDKKRGKFKIIGAADSLLLSSPVGIALADDGLFVADSAIGKVYKFDHQQKLVQTLDQFARPTSLAYDHLNQRLYVVDTAGHFIAVLDEHGKTLQSMGGRGSGEGEFNYPTHIALMDDRLLVVDSLNFRVQILSFNGEFLGSFGVHGDQPGQFAQPKGIATDGDGNIYIAESISGLIQIFDLDGNFLMSFGSLGNDPGSFLLPAGIYIEGDRIYVSDSGNGRVQLFRYQGSQK